MRWHESIVYAAQAAGLSLEQGIQLLHGQEVALPAERRENGLQIHEHPAEPLTILETVLAASAAEVVAHVAVHEVEAEQLQSVTPKKSLDRYSPIS